jgi:hypothetical protein
MFSITYKGWPIHGWADRDDVKVIDPDRKIIKFGSLNAAKAYIARHHVPITYEDVEGNRVDSNCCCQVDHYRTFCHINQPNATVDDVKAKLQTKWEVRGCDEDAPGEFAVCIRSMSPIGTEAIARMGFSKVTGLRQVVVIR